MNTILDLFPNSKIECPSIKLIALDGSGLEINGCGIISLQEYQLQIISNKDLHIILLQRNLTSSSGKIIAETEFFQLEAVDINGNIWKSQKILIGNSTTTQHGSILYAKIYELINEYDNFKQEIFTIKLLYKDEIKIPTNTAIKTIKEELHSGKTLEVETQFAMSKKKFCDLSFEVFNDNGWTILEISSNQNVTEMIAQRISEAFQFITACSTSWDCMFIYGKNNHDLLKSIIRFNKPTVKYDLAPIRHDNHLLYENDFWVLFEKYFTFIKDNQKDIIHPLSRIIFDIQSVENNILLQALVWSTAIETILTEYFDSIESIIDEDIEKLKSHLKKGEKRGCYNKSFYNRILGTLNAMKKPRPKDYLKLFITKNFIEKNLYDAYDEIRNAAAHGKQIDIEKIQGHLNKLSKVLVLFYNLIFLKIGYTGNYINYGEFGYPNKVFSAIYMK